MSALRELLDHYRDGPVGGEQVVGYLGADVPCELIAAAGLLPVRLRGNGPRSDLAEKVLGPRVDEPTRLVLARLLESGPPAVDFVVLCHDSDSSVRLYTSLRALARSDPSLGLPEVAFLDLLHLPTDSTAAYNRDRLDDLVGVVGRWSGRHVSDADLRDAIAAANESRRLLARVQELRRRTPPFLTGVEALAVIGAGTRLQVSEYNRLLAALLEESTALEPHHGRRVYLTGSGHDSAEIYGAIEQRGAVVVGEDHDWGEALADGPVDEAAPPLAAIASRYHRGSALGRRHGSGDRAAYTAREAEAAAAELVVSWIRTGDDAHAWDLPEQRRLLAARGIPLAVLDQRDLHLADPGELDAALATGVPA